MLSLEMKTLDQMLMVAYRVEISVLVQVDELYQELVIDHHNSRRHGREITVRLNPHLTIRADKEHRVQSVAEAFAMAVRLVPSGGKPILSTVIGGVKEVTSIARTAFAESFGIPDTADVVLESDVERLRKELVYNSIVSQLKEGAEGLERWNRVPGRIKNLVGISLEKVSMPNMQLVQFNCQGLVAEGADFEGSIMENATFTDAKITGAVFRKCNLDGANFSNCWSNNVDFSNASMKGVNSYDGTFKKAKFKNTDLTGARFRKADFCGTDFTDANMSDVQLEECKFDEKTSLPPSLKNTNGLQWKGKGKNPLVDVAGITEDIAFETVDELVAYLKRHLDGFKVNKATDMLRKDRFRLFYEISDQYLRGIVKSQSDPDLVYSCSLDSDGNYSCCSQNLNVCGGLKGSLCKHLLVLLIGLAKGGSLSYSKAALWGAASKVQNPRKIDKDAMAELFLKYKGAEAGEIDWRPTETMPEDYYAF